MNLFDLNGSTLNGEIKHSDTLIIDLCNNAFTFSSLSNLFADPLLNSHTRIILARRFRLNHSTIC